MKNMFQNLITIFFITINIQCLKIETNASNNYIIRQAFQEFSDYIYDTTNLIYDYTKNSMLLSSHTQGEICLPENVKKGSIIFVNVESLQKFIIDIHKYIKNPYILITHVYDRSITKECCEKYLNSKKLIAWFAINKEFDHPKLFGIPIGIFQLDPIYKNRDSINKRLLGLRAKSKSKLLYLNFKFTHPEREQVFNYFSHTNFCDIITSPTSWDQYMEAMSNYKFVVSPRGYGLDSYRTWEALLVGSIPIVKSSPLNPLYENLPILVISDWSDVNENFLQAKYKEIISKKYDLEKLYCEYWFTQILLKKEHFSY